MSLLYLSRADVESLQISMSSVIDAVEEGFRRKGLGQTQMPPKTPIYPRGRITFLHAMPAYVAGVEAAAVKWVGGADDNRERGLPTITGLLILNDPVSMLPLAVMDCTWLTMMRTGAANAVAMKYLGPRAPQEMALIGCGVQGRSVLTAAKVVYPGLKRVRVYDVFPEAADKYIREMAESQQVEIIGAPDPKAAIIGADIVVTASTMPADAPPYIEESWIKPGAMAAPVDYNVGWQAEVFTAVDKFITDDVAQMEYYRETRGYFKGLPAAAELGDVVAGKIPGRETDEERTMSMCMGIAIDDAVTAKLIHGVALERGVGTELPL
ncbi:MAG: ornithine cyclodeaminase family protein [Armatimonadia bacterium]